MDEQNWGRLTIRAKDAAGRPQMAEGRLPAKGGITPNDDFFLVHHYAPAEVSNETWSLTVKGDAGRSSTYSLPEIVRLPQHSVVAALECAGMSRGLLTSRRPGTQFGHGMVGTATWTGVRLRDVLKDAGMKPDFGCLVVRGSDSGVTQPENEHADFSKGLPKEKALHEDTLLAHSMNGEPIPWLHGGPVRLVVPGWFGVWWVKWPRSIEPEANEKYDGFWQSTRYTYQSDDKTQLGVVRELLPRSIILTPDPSATVKRGALRVSGLAWGGERPISRVDLTIDEGQSWTPARITETYGRWAWVRWEATLELDGPAGIRSIAVRAMDESGRSQDWSSAVNRLGYGNNRIFTTNISVVA